jgi:hypothetical protein
MAEPARRIARRVAATARRRRAEAVTRTVLADPEPVRLLAAGLSDLDDRCQRQEVALPAVYAALVDRDGISLLPTLPAYKSVQPWTTVDEGRRWYGPAGAFGASSDQPRPGAYPYLVTVGVHHRARVLVDTAQFDGIVALEGDTRRSRDFILQLSDDLLHSPWSAAPAITVVGFGADLDWDPAIRQLPNLDEAVRNDRLSMPNDRRPEDLSTLSTADEAVIGTAVVTRTRQRPLDARPRHFLFVAEPLSEPDVDRLHELMLDPDARWGVWVLGPVPGTRWRFTIDHHGQLVIPALTLTATTVVATPRRGWRYRSHDRRRVHRPPLSFQRTGAQTRKGTGPPLSPWPAGTKEHVESISSD